MVTFTIDQRVQTISSFSKKHFILDWDWCQFANPQHSKQSQPDRVIKPITLYKWTEDVDLCVVSTSNRMASSAIKDKFDDW